MMAYRSVNIKFLRKEIILCWGTKFFLKNSISFNNNDDVE